MSDFKSFCLLLLFAIVILLLEIRIYYYSTTNLKPNYDNINRNINFLKLNSDIFITTPKDESE